MGTGGSVPDSDILISLSEVLDTPVHILLGEKMSESQVDDLKAISEKLEVINLQLAHRKVTGKKILHWVFISLCVIIITIFVILSALERPYLKWDYNDPETAVLGVIFHSLEWLFTQTAPILFIGAAIVIFLTRKK